MIGIIFEFGTEIVDVRIKNNTIFFRTSQFVNFSDIDGIKLNKVGVFREFPDLKDKKNWQEIARERFKKKITAMKTERERADYIIEDLKKYGYKPKYEQVQGFRPTRIK